MNSVGLHELFVERDAVHEKFDPWHVERLGRFAKRAFERLRVTLGLDQPYLVRFGQWLGGVLQGDLGTSIFSRRPVMELIIQRLEPTIALTITVALT